ncbi:hypothetical protein Asppvi_005774 [Aspergillus pseudoviridinutans]|uniref:NAD(P)-binding protein n=1 Tax=Aspergillus pseudoviridinutans TaxID=1517512 RepID=A0A9P3ESW0_9EURO|nr:uncharacterized protein Asppvi_005774 [Aspergillus pseudoviridinutans]GIJ86876.1 hypothetical protein Asppvi_005774 [Aspergillus pseudoviridinutans]
MSNILDMIRVVLFGSHNDASRDGAPAFDPAQDIPSMADKVIFITGAAGDLGRETALALARYGRPSRIYIADLPRSDDAKQALTHQIDSEAYGDSISRTSETAVTTSTEIRYLDVDLASFDSVRKCAQKFAAQEQRLDILILNAGIIRVPPATTMEGYEIHFGVNYLGHALLTRLLMPMLLRTTQRQPGADVRVVVVSSEGHVSAPKQGVDFDLVKTSCSNLPYPKRYGQSKAALIGLMKVLSRDYPQIKTVAIHPGRILTGMARSLWKESTLARLTKPIAPFFCVPVTTGIRNHLWAATSSEVVSGTYYEPVGVPGKLSPALQDESFPGRLREWTDNVLGRIESLE